MCNWTFFPSSGQSLNGKKKSILIIRPIISISLSQRSTTRWKQLFPSPTGETVSKLEKGPETRPDSACYDSNSRETVKGCRVTVMLNRYTRERNTRLLMRRHGFPFLLLSLLFLFFFSVFFFYAGRLVFARRTRNGRTNDRGKRSWTPTGLHRNRSSAANFRLTTVGSLASCNSSPARVNFFVKRDDILIVQLWIILLDQLSIIQLEITLIPLFFECCINTKTSK